MSRQVRGVHVPSLSSHDQMIRVQDDLHRIPMDWSGRGWPHFRRSGDVIRGIQALSRGQRGRVRGDTKDLLEWVIGVDRRTSAWERV